MVDLAENTIRYLNAGHPALIEYNKITSETSIIDRSSSIPVGWLDSYQYKEDEEVTIPLSSDSVYFLYTDGLFECLNTEGLELGVSGFTRFLKDFEPQMDSILLPFIIKQKLIDEKYDLTGDDFTLLTLQKYDSDSKKDNLLLRYSIKDKQQVAEAVQNFIQEKYDNKEFYLIVNSIIANHIHNIINNLTAARIKYTILIQLVKSPDYLELTFWEKHDFAPVFDKITLTEADNYISDYNFNRYEITRNHYDDIIESIIKVPFK
jgi:REP element-mobilizing transposase RayT